EPEQVVLLAVDPPHPALVDTNPRGRHQRDARVRRQRDPLLREEVDQADTPRRLTRYPPGVQELVYRPEPLSSRWILVRIVRVRGEREDPAPPQPVLRFVEEELDRDELVGGVQVGDPRFDCERRGRLFDALVDRVLDGVALPRVHQHVSDDPARSPYHYAYL